MWAGVLRVNVSGGPSSKTRDGAGGVGAGGGGRGQAADFHHIMDQSDVTDHRPLGARPWEGRPRPRTPLRPLPAQWTSHGSSKVRATSALGQPRFRIPTSFPR